MSHLLRSLKLPVVTVGASLLLAAGVAVADKSARLSVAVSVDVNCAVSVGDLDLDPQGTSGAVHVSIGCVSGGDAAVILEDPSSLAGASGCTFYQDAAHRRAWGDQAGAGNSHLGGGRRADSTIYVQLPARGGGSAVMATILF
jgi:hypothetical protein